jgi:hypothetical protein
MHVWNRFAGTVTCGLLLTAAVASTAAAQTAPSAPSAQTPASPDRVFGGISVGQQTKSRTFTSSGSQPLYDETATFESTVGIGQARIIDANAGARVWNDIAVSLGVSMYKDTASGTLTASVPDPVLFDTPRASSVNVENFDHEQTQIHLSVSWLKALTQKLQLTVSAGPTLFLVKQDVVDGINVPAGGTSIASITSTAIDESTVGYHAGFDVRYMVIKNVGAGVFARYTGGSLTTDLLEGGKMDVGGFQYGAGLRFRF